MADDAAAEPTAGRAAGPIAANPGVQTTTRYGILGGTFDPPHVGHLILAQEVHARLGLGRVVFVPAGAPPHKPERVITPTAHRLTMLRLAIAGDARFALSTVELDRPGPSYTVDTLHALRAAWGREIALDFVLGWDMLLYLPYWHDPAGVVAALDRLVAVHRPGVSVDTAALAEVETRVPGLRDKLITLPFPQLEISSTMLRQRVASSLPIRYLTPDSVCDYIADQGLYQTPPEEPAGAREEAKR